MTSFAASPRHDTRIRLIALILSLALALSTLAASYTVDVLHDHDCQGENCVACHVVGMATSLLGAHVAPAARVVSACCIALFGAFAIMLWRAARAAETPVSLCDLLLI